VCSVVVWLVMIIAFATVNPFKQEDNHEAAWTQDA
jgi:hypothetical protein